MMTIIGTRKGLDFSKNNHILKDIKKKTYYVFDSNFEMMEFLQLCERRNDLIILK